MACRCNSSTPRRGTSDSARRAARPVRSSAGPLQLGAGVLCRRHAGELGRCPKVPVSSRRVVCARRRRARSRRSTCGRARRSRGRPPASATSSSPPQLICVRSSCRPVARRRRRSWCSTRSRELSSARYRSPLIHTSRRTRSIRRVPNLVGPLGPGPLSLINWTQSGAPHFAETSISPASDAVFGVAPDVRRDRSHRGAPHARSATRCFAPIDSDCDYRSDAPTLPPEAVQTPFAPGGARKPWSATASASGQVAILERREIVIWDPVRHRVGAADSPVSLQSATTSRRTTSRSWVPRRTVVWSWLPTVAAVVGPPRVGIAPAWRYAWAGPSFNSPTPVLISNDGTTVGVTAFGGMQFVDGRTGRLAAHGPTVEADIQIGGGSLTRRAHYAQVVNSGAVTLIDTTTGTACRTLLSAHPVFDPGVICGDPVEHGRQHARDRVQPGRSHGRGWHDARESSLERQRATRSRCSAAIPPTRGDAEQTGGHRHLRRGVPPPPTGGVPVGRHTSGRRRGELVSVVAGVPTNSYTSRLRTVAWSLRPSDWQARRVQHRAPRPHASRVVAAGQRYRAIRIHVHAAPRTTKRHA